MIQLAWLIPLLPLIGFAIIAFGGKKLSHGLVSMIGSGSVLGSFLLSLGVFFTLGGKSETVTVLNWIHVGDFHVSFSFLIDPLSSLFLLIITGIGFLIHVYSMGYMHDDDKYDRFFAYLNLFVFFMLLLVMGDSYLLMFVGWEGVGLCSYLLIGFWFKNMDYNNAAKKAFIVNRIGDLGFLLGMILIFTTFGTLDYNAVFSKMSAVTGEAKLLMNTIGILLFIGACGKSAQIPLYTWLPDAMAGPTPVSALIHAATMVTAGIYMIARSSLIFAHAEIASEVVAIVGAATMLFAATIGLFQNDIKKVLAYSTVSQLGIMFLGLGVGAYTGAVFHVMTHAFFKALLFLGAGSVIHAVSGEQDIRKMGGLQKVLPVTHLTFLIGTIAISGIPPFSGFFSKDEILAHAYAHNPVYWVIGLVGSMMTAFYMFRLYFLTFKGEFRGTKEQKEHLHESPSTMTFPLMVLAVLSIFGGLLGIPLIHGAHWLAGYLAPVVGKATLFMGGNHHASVAHELLMMGIAVAAAIFSIMMAHSIFMKNKSVPGDPEKLSGFKKLVYHKYNVDEIYDALIRKPLDVIADYGYRFMELRIVDGMVNGVGWAVTECGSLIRQAQTGKIGFYIFVMTLALIAALLILIY
jgi:NADH-quinone oxidoreductase subunit L